MAWRCPTTCWPSASAAWPPPTRPACRPCAPGRRPSRPKSRWTSSSATPWPTSTAGRTRPGRRATTPWSSECASARWPCRPALPFSTAVAKSLFKLMSYKDEYEVARLYTDGRFLERLREQFEGDLQLEFHMAPPFLAKSRHGQPPREDPPRRVDVAGDALAGARQAPARHGAGRLRPHRGAPHGACADHAVRSAHRRTARTPDAADREAGHRDRRPAADDARLSATSRSPTSRWRGCARPSCCTSWMRSAGRDRRPAAAPGRSAASRWWRGDNGRRLSALGWARVARQPPRAFSLAI
jgi:hypothetical protein